MPTNKQLRRKRSKKTNRTLNMSLKKIGGAKPNLIILIGAGQNWKYNQFHPEKQPSNSVIHVVDPLVLKYPNYVSCLACDEDMTEWNQSRRDEHVKGCEQTIRRDLKGLNSNNQFYKMKFNDYIPVLFDIIEQFNTIIVITYTEMVKMNDVMPFLPQEQSLFIYDGHGADGIPIAFLEQINMTFKPLIDRLNTLREYIDEQMSMVEGKEKIELEAERARDNGMKAIIGFLQTAVDMYNNIIEQIVDILGKSKKNTLLIILVHRLIDKLKEYGDKIRYSFKLSEPHADFGDKVDLAPPLDTILLQQFKITVPGDWVLVGGKKKKRSKRRSAKTKK